MVKQSFFQQQGTAHQRAGPFVCPCISFGGWAAELKNYSLALENEFCGCMYGLKPRSLRWRISPAAGLVQRNRKH